MSIRGYNVFFDLDEMRRDRFDIQIYEYIDNAKDVFIILEEGSLKSIYDNSYKNDWFCKEVAYAIRKNKNIIPVLINGLEIPDSRDFPPELAQLPLINSLVFGGISYFDDYINKLERKRYLNSTPNNRKDIQNYILNELICDTPPNKRFSNIRKSLFLIIGIGILTITGIKIYSSLLVHEDETVRLVDTRTFDKPAIIESQIPTNDEVSIKLQAIRDKADAGDIPAMSTLGNLYRRKESPLYNIDEAIRYYQKALDAGFAEAADILLELETEKISIQK